MYFTRNQTIRIACNYRAMIVISCKKTNLIPLVIEGMYNQIKK